MSDLRGRAEVLREIESTRRELDTYAEEVARCESILAELEDDLRQIDAHDRQRLSTLAQRLFDLHRPSGYEHTLLTLALLQEPLDDDQHARFQQLSREYLLELV